MKKLLKKAVVNGGLLSSRDVLCNKFYINLIDRVPLVYCEPTEHTSCLILKPSHQKFTLELEKNEMAYYLMFSAINFTIRLFSESLDSPLFYTCNSGFSCFFVPQNTSIQITLPEQKENHLNIMVMEHQVNIDFHDDLITNETDLQQVLDSQNDFQVIKILNALSVSINQSKTNPILYHSFSLNLYAHLLYQIHASLQSNSSFLEQSNQELKIAEAANILENDLKSYHTVHELATRVGLSEANLQEGFRRNYGYTVNVYLKKKRLELALDLLTNTDLNISEIVFAIGLNSRSYFSEIFKSNLGITPTSFRKKIRSTHYK